MENELAEGLGVKMDPKMQCYALLLGEGILYGEQAKQGQERKSNPVSAQTTEEILNFDYLEQHQDVI